MLSTIAIVLLVLWALGFIGGLNGPGTKPLGDHKNIAHIGVPVALLFLIVWLIF